MTDADTSRSGDRSHTRSLAAAAYRCYQEAIYAEDDRKDDEYFRPAPESKTPECSDDDHHQRDRPNGHGEPSGDRNGIVHAKRGRIKPRESNQIPDDSAPAPRGSSTKLDNPTTVRRSGTLVGMSDLTVDIVGPFTLMRDHEGWRLWYGRTTPRAGIAGKGWRVQHLLLGRYRWPKLAG
jgi:hypothetical protein